SAQELLNRKVSLHVENRRVTEILSHIEKQAGVRFTYRTTLLPETQLLTVNYQNDRLADVLEQLLTPMKIKYRIIGRQIVLTPGDTAERPAGDQPAGSGISVPVPADIRIRGSVKDEKGEGLPGVSVLVKGTQMGTTTDISGN